MHGIMLGAGQQLLVGSILGSLQASHHTLAHHSRQVRVFAVGLLSAPPSRVAEDVDVGCPEREVLVHLALSAEAMRMIVLDACLVADSREDAFHKHRVERRSHCHRDGEHRGVAVAAHAMQRLAPPLEDRHIEAFYGAGMVHHQSHLLLQRQPLAEVLGTFLRTEIGILIGIALCLCRAYNKQQNAENGTFLRHTGNVFPAKIANLSQFSFVFFKKSVTLQALR